MRSRMSFSSKKLHDCVVKFKPRSFARSLFRSKRKKDQIGDWIKRRSKKRCFNSTKNVLKEIGQTGFFFILFSSFSQNNNKYSTIDYTWWCAWDSNPWLQDTLSYGGPSTEDASRSFLFPVENLPTLIITVVERIKGRESWSSGYGWRLVFQRLWVRIPATYTGWTLFHIYLL